jgi:hypothetical protein
MRRFLFWLVAAGFTPLLASGAWGSEVKGADPGTGKAPPAVPGAPTSKFVEAVKPDGDSCHGTTIHFVDTPGEAAKLAKKQEKLVMVLHVSGLFEDPRFT